MPKKFCPGKSFSNRRLSIAAGNSAFGAVGVSSNSFFFRPGSLADIPPAAVHGTSQFFKV
jgi:hypothetical protein